MVTDFNVIVNMENPNSIAPLFWNSFFQKSPDIQFLINYNDYYEKGFSDINQTLQIKFYTIITPPSIAIFLTTK